jgi:hypothetical protein
MYGKRVSCAPKEVEPVYKTELQGSKDNARKLQFVDKAKE